MSSPRENIQTTISTIKPFDELEQAHQLDALKWVASNAPLFRISKPDNPPKHLVSYFVLFDETDQSVMLVDHVKARLWLPPGGHVDVNEYPYDTVIREADEELRIKANFDTPFGTQPFFVTVTLTKGAGQHTDVSLWYVIKGLAGEQLWFDTDEMNSYKWLHLDDILSTGIDQLDPHMHRFVAKLKSHLGTAPTS